LHTYNEEAQSRAEQSRAQNKKAELHCKTAQLEKQGRERSATTKHISDCDQKSSSQLEVEWEMRAVCVCHLQWSSVEQGRRHTTKQIDTETANFKRKAKTSY
jgi:hypothetical protein